MVNQILQSLKNLCDSLGESHAEIHISSLQRKYLEDSGLLTIYPPEQRTASGGILIAACDLYTMVSDLETRSQVKPPEKPPETKPEPSPGKPTDSPQDNPQEPTDTPDDSQEPSTNTDPVEELVNTQAEETDSPEPPTKTQIHKANSAKLKEYCEQAGLPVRPVAEDNRKALLNYYTD